MKVLDYDGLEYYNDHIESTYLPKSGGTMSGNIGYISGNNRNFSMGFAGEANIDIGWNYGNGDGAGVGLRNIDYATEADKGSFCIFAKNGSTVKSLNGRTDGTLTWGGNRVITSAGGNFTGNIVLDKSGTSPVVGTPIVLPVVYKTKTTASGNAVYDTTPFFVFPTSDTANNGTGFGIQTGGALVIGGGESPRALVSALTLNGGTENAYLTADSTVYIVTNGNTIANRKTFAFTADGKLQFPDGSTIWIA